MNAINKKASAKNRKRILIALLGEFKKDYQVLS